MNLELWKTRKKELKLNYTEIADLSGVSKRTIEDLFRGYTTNPRIETVQAIEKVLGIGGTEWTEEERLQGVVDNISTIITADEDEIITLLREVEERKGAAARDVAQRVIVSVLEEILK